MPIGSSEDSALTQHRQHEVQLNFSAVSRGPDQRPDTGDMIFTWHNTIRLFIGGGAIARVHLRSLLRIILRFLAENLILRMLAAKAAQRDLLAVPDAADLTLAPTADFIVDVSPRGQARGQEKALRVESISPQVPLDANMQLLHDKGAASHVKHVKGTPGRTRQRGARGSGASRKLGRPLDGLSSYFQP